MKEEERSESPGSNTLTKFLEVLYHLSGIAYYFLAMAHL